MCQSQIQIWVSKAIQRSWPKKNVPRQFLGRDFLRGADLYLFITRSKYGYGSIPINTIFRGMNIHLPAILMFTRGTRFDTLPYVKLSRSQKKVSALLHNFLIVLLVLLLFRFSLRMRIILRDFWGRLPVAV